MARNIVNTADRTISIPIIRKFNPKWLVISFIVACVIGGGTIGGYYLYNGVTSTAELPTPPVQPGIVPASPTETPIETPAIPTVTPAPAESEKVLAGGQMGSLIDRLDNGNFVSYGLGVWFVPPGGPPWQYDFPLVISRQIEGVTKIIATITDPGIEQTGGEWSSDLIADPDYPNFVFRVKLIRVEEIYKYKTEFYCSPVGGAKWYSPMFSPPN